jgi:hypothetical protein
VMKMCMLPSRIWQISSSLCQFVDWFFILNSETLLRIKDFKKNQLENWHRTPCDFFRDGLL